MSYPLELVEKLVQISHDACLKHYSTSRDIDAEPMATHRSIVTALLKELDKHYERTRRVRC